MYKICQKYIKTALFILFYHGTFFSKQINNGDYYHYLFVMLDPGPYISWAGTRALSHPPSSSEDFWQHPSGQHMSKPSIVFCSAVSDHDAICFHL